ncbi:hypothetical protein ATCC90586_008011 [Pythium insidiosum]|nr:hypothetical protein ATCC90586_008011 [Pythium insidiosum]
MGLLGKVFGLENKGKIGLTVDKPSYIAGELVVGTIYLSVFEPIECDALVVKATGKEKVKWTHITNRTDADGTVRTVEEEHDKEKEFFKQKIVVASVPTVYSPGNYMYRFEYQLPADLPGVFTMHKFSEGTMKNMDADIKYKLKATLDVGGFFAKDLKAKCLLVVHERLTQGITPSEDATTQQVNFLCCFNKGTCTLAVAMDKNVYLPGEVAQISCRIQNSSTVDIQAMRCKLLQDVTMIADHGVRHRFTRKISEQTFPGVSAGQSVDQPQPLPLVANTGYESHINPSTHGRLVECTYRVDIECDIPWCPDVHLRMPVTIIAPMIVNMSWVPPSPELFQQSH